MATFSGVYQHYEGTDADCATVQKEREVTWATDIGTSGALRYYDCSGNVHYIGPGLGDSVWTEEISTSGLIPNTTGIYYGNYDETYVRIGPAGLRSGVFIAYLDVTPKMEGSASGLYLISAKESNTGGNGNDLIAGRSLWLCAADSLYLQSYNTGITLDASTSGNFSTGDNLDLNVGANLNAEAEKVYFESDTIFDVNVRDGNVPTEATTITLNSDSSASGELNLLASTLINVQSSKDIFVGADDNLDIVVSGDIVASGDGDMDLYIDGTLDIHAPSWLNIGTTLGTSQITISGRNLNLATDHVWTEQNYDFTPDIRGFSSVEENNCAYHSIGQLHFVTLHISGIGNGDPTEVELPHYSETPNNIGQGIFAGYDGQDYPLDSTIAILPGDTWTTYAKVFVDDNIPSYESGYVYGSGVRKWLCGSFWYFAEY